MCFLFLKTGITLTAFKTLIDFPVSKERLKITDTILAISRGAWYWWDMEQVGVSLWKCQDYAEEEDSTPLQTRLHQDIKLREVDCWDHDVMKLSNYQNWEVLVPWWRTKKDIRSSWV